VPQDVASFIKRHGGARRTDLTIGKVNVSDEFGTWIRHSLMTKVSPEVVGWELARRKESLKLEIEDLDRQASDLFGVSTIEEWVAREKDGEAAEGEIVRAQRALRKQIRDEKLEELDRLWKIRHDRGTHFTKSSETSWAKGHAKELRLLELTPEEYVARKLQQEARI